MTISTALIDGIEHLCRVANADRETTRRIVDAVSNKPTKDTGKLMTTRAVAARLECHPKSVLRYAKRGLLTPVRRSPRCLRWKQSEVERLATEGVACV